MKKEKNKKLIYIILPLIMLIPVVILLLSNDIAWMCLVVLVFYIQLLDYLIPVLIILDIICFVYAKEAMGIIGIIEAFVFVIYPVVTYCLFQFGYHHMYE